MNNVHINVCEYDSNHTSIRTQSGPGYDYSSWEYVGYQHTVGPWSVSLHENTRYLVLVFSGNCVTSPAYLDVDCVTVGER